MRERKSCQGCMIIQIKLQTMLYSSLELAQKIKVLMI